MAGEVLRWKLGRGMGADCKDIPSSLAVCAPSRERRRLQEKWASSHLGGRKSTEPESSPGHFSYLRHGDWTGSCLKILQTLAFIRCCSFQIGKCHRNCESRLISQGNGPDPYLLGCSLLG